jgi:hypothetical protein
MSCPECGQRKARRDCPALGRMICSVCCGTKRLVEINCPESCPHLVSARANPAAAVRRQHEADLAIVWPAVQHLTERQQQLFYLFHSVIAQHRPEGFARLVDADVADAAAAAAATLETAAKGVIYEHAAQSVVAQRLVGELMTLLKQAREQGAVVYDREAAISLRAIEAGARSVRAAGGGADDAYLVLMARLLQVNRRADPAGADAPALGLGGSAGEGGSSIILP